MSALIIDTETTGFDKPDVIELAYIGPFTHPGSSLGRDKKFQQRFKPRKPISLGAMATHHITFEDLVDKPEWQGSWSPPDELGDIDYIIGHNVDFDWAAIGSPDVKRICTLALARYVWPLLDSHSLGAIMYHIHVEQPRYASMLLTGAHSAVVDADLCLDILNLLWLMIGEPKTWEELWVISEKARIPKFFTFGKYGPQNYPPTGKEVSWVKANDRGYVKWCLSASDMDPYLIKELSR